MKKIIMLTLVVSMVLTGCQNTNTTDVDITNDSIETEAPENTIPTYSAEEDAEAAEYLASNLWIDNWYSQYRRNTNYKSSCTDAIAAVVLLNSNVIQDERMLSLAINTDVNSPEYGRTIIEENGNVRVVMSVDTALYWDFVTDLICHMQGESEKGYAYYIDANT